MVAALRVPCLSGFHRLSSRQSSKFDNYSADSFQRLILFCEAKYQMHSAARYLLPFETSHRRNDLKRMLLNPIASVSERTSPLSVSQFCLPPYGGCLSKRLKRFGS